MQWLGLSPQQEGRRFDSDPVPFCVESYRLHVSRDDFYALKFWSDDDFFFFSNTKMRQI